MARTHDTRPATPPSPQGWLCHVIAVGAWVHVSSPTMCLFNNGHRTQQDRAKKSSLNTAHAPLELRPHMQRSTSKGRVGSAGAGAGVGAGAGGSPRCVGPSRGGGGQAGAPVSLGGPHADVTTADTATTKKRVRGRGVGRDRGLHHNGEPVFEEKHPSWQVRACGGVNCCGGCGHVAWAVAHVHDPTFPPFQPPPPLPSTTHATPHVWPQCKVRRTRREQKCVRRSIKMLEDGEAAPVPYEAVVGAGVAVAGAGAR
jgi:hypothetical protein